MAKLVVPLLIVGALAGAAFVWWPALDGLRQSLDTVAEATPVDAGPRAPAAASDMARWERDEELAALRRAFARQRDGLGSRAPDAERGDVGERLDPDGRPGFVAGTSVVNVGEYLDPELAPAPGALVDARLTNVGEYIEPLERP